MSKPTDGPQAPGRSRRTVLQAALGATAGSGALTGFPTLWAQNIKDIVIQHAGPPVTAIGLIADQATKDLGFTVRMQASENADLLNRFLSQSSAIDVADVSLPFLKYLVGRNVLQAMPRGEAVELRQVDPAVHQGQVSGWPRRLAAGHRALRRALRGGCRGQELRQRRERVAAPASRPSPMPIRSASAPT